jgi:hypothetical protein
MLHNFYANCRKVMQFAAGADILKAVTPKKSIEKRFTVVLDRETYESIEEVAETRKRSVSSEAGLALRSVYGGDPYAIDILTGIAAREGIKPGDLLIKLLEDYTYQKLAKGKEPAS